MELYIALPFIAADIPSVPPNKVFPDIHPQATRTYDASSHCAIYVRITAVQEDEFWLNTLMTQMPSIISSYFVAKYKILYAGSAVVRTRSN